jgi:glycine cleavage system H protein
VNQNLTQRPEQVNHDPYGAGWLIVIEMSAPKELEALMNAADYEAYLQKAGGGH